MKIITLQAENIKRLIAVEIHPDGSLVQINGKNGSGKTSLLDSIWWALSGARSIQASPIRKGQREAKIKLDLGEIVVTRSFKKDDEGEAYTTKLEVAGNVKGSPQAVLDSLLDSLAFDPLHFARMDSKQQFEALRKFVPSVDFDKIASENSLDAAKRKEINAAAKRERTLADQIQVPAELPARPDVDALIATLSAASDMNTKIGLEIARRQRIEPEAATFDLKAGKLRARAVELEAEAVRMKEEAARVEFVAADMRKALAALPALDPTVDVAEVQKNIADARATCAVLDRAMERGKHVAEAKRLESESKALTERMVRRDSEKTSKISKSELPVPGLTFGTDANGYDCVLLSGLPFEQASDAEQLRASCALAMAGNPTLRVIRVRDGSLLDEDGLKLLAKMAEERDFQCWIEKVGSGKVGFTLEDGRIIDTSGEDAAPQGTLL